MDIYKDIVTIKSFQSKPKIQIRKKYSLIIKKNV